MIRWYMSTRAHSHGISISHEPSRRAAARSFFERTEKVHSHGNKLSRPHSVNVTNSALCLHTRKVG
jgi:hypothetical protein